MTPLDPIGLTILLMAVVVVGGAFDATRPFALLLLLTILAGLVLSNYGEIHNSVKAAFAPSNGGS